MALTLYKKKRNFKITSEPEGEKKDNKGKLIFTIQKHHASHLHYDFRLEMEGVLKSWAVPKGPSLNPDDKRLAMTVEDHPYDYKDFEGNIPEGSYGGGNVIVWDRGTYELPDGGDRKEQEKKLLAALKKGDLKFILHGKKLNGEFALVKIKNSRQENAWLLIKKKDKYVSNEDVTKKEKSVISGVTLGALAKKYDNDKNGISGDEKVKSTPAKTSRKKPKGSKTENSTDDFELKVGKQLLKFTNQNKIYWPEEGITKGQLVNYYASVSDLILPYLKDRPQSLHRFPNGVKDAGFYQKDIDKSKVPTWLKTESVYSESNNKNIDYLICNDKETLLYMANLGCIEMHPWNSRIQSPENPDWMVIDLDPENIAFTEVVKAAQETRKFLEGLSIDCYCKTSGATGLHIYVPLNAKYEYEIVKEFAQVVATHVNEVLPDTTSILRMPAKRKKKVYLDFLQNRRAQTLAAPYSVRPKPGATVSTPLEWSEVNAKLDVTKFTINTLLKRIEKKGDLWKPVLGKGANLDKAIKQIYEDSGRA